VPEGDVVRRTAERLHAALAGRTLTRCDLRWPSLATVDLTGQEVLEVVSAGKHLLLRTSAGVTLHSHLRMEGSWRVRRSLASDLRVTADVRAVIGNPQWTALGHRLGVLGLVATARENAVVGHLGPDVLGATWDPDEAARRLIRDPDRAVGEALMDQRLVAGVGTFYACEACFLRGITPWTPVGAAGPPERLLDLVHRLMSANAARAVQVTTGDARRGHEQWVHARSGRPCRRCGTTVRVAPLGTAPHERVAFYCPRCQIGPAPTDDGRPQAPLGSAGLVRHPGGPRGGYRRR
jgi:endonuclease-8